MQNTWYFTLLMGVIAAFPGSSRALASQPISIKNLSRQPALQSVTMSPDGKHIVALIPSPDNPDMTALAVWDTNDLVHGAKVVTPSGKHMHFIAATALKTGKILAVARQEWTGRVTGCGLEGKSIGSTRTFLDKVYLTDDQQKHFEEAFKSQRHRLSSNRNLDICQKLATTAKLVDMLPLDPNNVIIERLNKRSLTGDYYLYNLKTDKAKVLFHGNHRTTPVLFDSRTGKVLVKMQTDAVAGGYEQRFYIVNPKTGKFELQPALTNQLSKRHEVSVAGKDDTTGKYYILTDQFSDKVQVRLYDPVEQKFDPKPALADADYSIAGLIFSTRRSNFNKVVGFVIDGPYRQQVFIDPNLKAIQATAEKAFPGQQVSIQRYTDDFSKVLFSTQSASHPPAYHMVLDKHIVNLGSKRPWIKNNRTGQEKWVTYTARDGMKIHAILDLPAGWHHGDQSAPAIIMPHGGPWARDYTGWDPIGWVPMLTSRGYAVLRPQYRGSEGLGRKLWLAGDRQWGLKMSDDLDDGAAWLVKQGIASKQRIALFGYSYGGFAAVAADVRSPSPYQCVIAGAPVANLGRLGTSWSSNRLQRILQGQTIRGMDPMKNTDKAHLPILLFGGDRDVRVPSYHPRDFYQAVKNEVAAKYVVIPDMPHSLPWYPSQKAKVDHLVVDFLKNDCFNHSSKP